MFDLLNSCFALTEVAEIKDREWLVVQWLRDDYYIAVEKGSVPPSPLMLIRWPKEMRDAQIAETKEEAGASSV